MITLQEKVLKRDIDEFLQNESDTFVVNNEEVHAKTVYQSYENQSVFFTTPALGKSTKLRVTKTKIL